MINALIELLKALPTALLIIKQIKELRGKKNEPISSEGNSSKA
jgi:hypothetical protein